MAYKQVPYLYRRENKTSKSILRSLCCLICVMYGIGKFISLSWAPFFLCSKMSFSHLGGQVFDFGRCLFSIWRAVILTYWTLTFRCWTLTFRCWTLTFWFWTLSFRFWVISFFNAERPLFMVCDPYFSMCDPYFSILGHHLL